MCNLSFKACLEIYSVSYFIMMYHLTKKNSNFYGSLGFVNGLQMGFVVYYNMKHRWAHLIIYVNIHMLLT